MAGSIAGQGYPVRAAKAFTLVFQLPSSITPGAYLYSYRTFYQCETWPFDVKFIPFQDEVNAQIVIP
jgi:hypothetical protein